MALARVEWNSETSVLTDNPKKLQGTVTVERVIVVA